MKFIKLSEHIWQCPVCKGQYNSTFSKIGSKCLYCGNVNTENDDIFVYLSPIKLNDAMILECNKEDIIHVIKTAMLKLDEKILRMFGIVSNRKIRYKVLCALHHDIIFLVEVE